MLKVTKKDDVMVCHICGNPLKVGDTYERITTTRGSEIVVHTDCIGK
jgi:hypothetical protein